MSADSEYTVPFNGSYSWGYDYFLPEISQAEKRKLLEVGIPFRSREHVCSSGQNVKGIVIDGNDYIEAAKTTLFKKAPDKFGLGSASSGFRMPNGGTRTLWFAPITGAGTTVSTGRRSVKQIEEESLLEFVALLSMNLKGEARCAAGDLASSERNAKHYEIELTKALVRCAQQKELMAVLKVGFSKQQPAMRKMFKDIKTIPQVKNMQLKDGWLIFRTTLCQAVDTRTGVLYDLGEYEVSLNLAYAGGDICGYVRFKNLTPDQNNRSGHLHPHVASPTDVCFGTAKQPIRQLWCAKEYPALIGLIINFLCQANINDSYGKTLIFFPVAKDQPPDAKEPINPDLDERYSGVRNRTMGRCPSTAKCVDCKRGKGDFTGRALEGTNGAPYNCMDYNIEEEEAVEEITETVEAVEEGGE